MFTHAAQRLGYHVAVWEPETDCPAGQAADRHFCVQDTEDPLPAMREMAQLCSVITLEFENVSPELLRQAAELTHTRPGAEFLEMCQDRLLEKAGLQAAGFPTTPFHSISDSQDVLQAAQQWQWPVVLKTTRSGYDGKGQVKVESPDHLAEVWPSLEGTSLIAERWIEFAAEVSVVTARNAEGEIACYPLFENQHARHILDVTSCPADASLIGLETEAQDICAQIAKQFGVVGLFCVEFFVTTEGKLLINEMAPRPHNSGHVTMDAFRCSQFEQQVRAICNLPLGTTEQLQPAAMANLLGDLWGDEPPNWQQAIQQSTAHLHLYGKQEPRPGRKMGHLNVLGSDARQAAELARQLRSELASAVVADATPAGSPRR